MLRILVNRHRRSILARQARSPRDLECWLESDTREGLGHQGQPRVVDSLSSSLTRLTEKRQLRHSTSAATDSAVAHARPVQRIE